MGGGGGFGGGGLGVAAMPSALAAEALPLIAEGVALVEVLSKTTWARLVVAAREANFTGSALLMTTFTMTMTTGSAWWARSLTTTAITTTGPIAGSRSASTPELDGVGTAFGPATSCASRGRSGQRAASSAQMFAWG